MFDVLGSLAKAAVGTVLLPVDLVVDTVTLPARVLDGREFSTEKRLRQIGENLDDAVER